MINFILLAAVAVIILVAIMLVALNLGALVGGEWCESHKDNGWFSAVLAIIFGVGMAVILIVGMNNTFGVVGVLGCIAATITGLFTAISAFLASLTWHDDFFYWSYYDDYFRYVR